MTIKQILEIRGTTRFFEIKKKFFLISIIDWKAVHMFVHFQKKATNEFLWKTQRLF